MLTSEMKFLFGYDEFGNCEALLAPCDKEAIESGDSMKVRRVSGDVICKCGVKYYRHPQVQGALWLVRVCDGFLAKL